MEYIIGQSYDMKVSYVHVEKIPSKIYYVLEENNHRLLVYDFEKTHCKRVKSIKCVFKGCDESGTKIFHRDRLFLMKDLYEPGHVYEFTYRSLKRKDDLIPSYNVKDIFGLQHVYQGELAETQKKQGAKIQLYLKEINEVEGKLVLESPKLFMKDSNNRLSSNNEVIEALFDNYIQNGEDAVLRDISKLVKADLKVEMWGSLYRMAQKLSPTPQTLKQIRSEIITAYRGVIDNNELPIIIKEQTSNVVTPDMQKLLTKLFNEGKTITEIMALCSLSRYEIIMQLKKLGAFYIS